MEFVVALVAGRQTRGSKSVLAFTCRLPIPHLGHNFHIQCSKWAMLSRDFLRRMIHQSRHAFSGTTAYAAEARSAGLSIKHTSLGRFLLRQNTYIIGRATFRCALCEQI